MKKTPRLEDSAKLKKSTINRVTEGHGVTHDLGPGEQAHTGRQKAAGATPDGVGQRKPSPGELVTP